MRSAAFSFQNDCTQCIVNITKNWRIFILDMERKSNFNDFIICGGVNLLSDNTAFTLDAYFDTRGHPDDANSACFIFLFIV